MHHQPWASAAATRAQTRIGSPPAGVTSSFNPSQASTFCRRCTGVAPGCIATPRRASSSASCCAGAATAAAGAATAAGAAAAAALAAAAPESNAHWPAGTGVRNTGPLGVQRLLPLVEAAVGQRRVAVGERAARGAAGALTGLRRGRRGSRRGGRRCRGRGWLGWRR